MLGRYFFHGRPLEVAVASVECVDGAAVYVVVAGTAPQKTRMQFDWVKFQQS